MPKTMGNTIIFDDNAGNLLQNGVIQTNQITSNGDVILGGSIVNGTNVIAFNEQYLFTDIYNNAHIYGTFFLDYGGTTYNVGQIISAGTGGTYAPYPSITYNSGTNTTTFTGGMVFPATSIASTAIDNTTFLNLTTNQSVSGTKTYSVSQIFTSDIRLDGALVLNTNTLSIPNSTLQNIQYLSNVSSDIGSNLSTLNTNVSSLLTKTTNMSFAGSTTTFTGNITLPVGSLPANRISGTALTLSGNQTITGTKTFTPEQIFNGNIRINASLVLSTNSTITNTQLEYLTGLTNDVQNSINELNAKVANQTTSGTNTTFTGNTIFDNIIFNSTINTIDTTTFSYLSGVNNPIQNQINSVDTKADNAQTIAISADNKASSALALATTASATAGSALVASAGAVATAGGALTSANGANSRCTALEGRVDNTETDIGALQVKTTRMSYNSATSRTTFTNTLQASSFQFTSLTSGFNQTSTSAITIRGATEIQNNLNITDGGTLTVDGGIQQLQNNPNAFNGTISANNNFTASGAQTSLNSTNTQIGATSLENLTINAIQTNNNDITIIGTKKLVLKNIVPLGLENLYFGGEAGAYSNYDVNFNMKVNMYEPLTVIDTVNIGTPAFRYNYTSYNSSVLIDANTTLALECSTGNINIYARIVNLGQTIGVNYLRGTTYIQNLATTTGVINAVGSAVRQF